MNKNNTRIKKYRFYRFSNIDFRDYFLNIFNKIKKLFKTKKENKELKNKDTTIYEYYLKKKRLRIIVSALIFVIVIGILIGVIFINRSILNG